MKESLDWRTFDSDFGDILSAQINYALRGSQSLVLCSTHHAAKIVGVQCLAIGIVGAVCANILVALLIILGLGLLLINRYVEIDLASQNVSCGVGYSRASAHVYAACDLKRCGYLRVLRISKRGHRGTKYLRWEVRFSSSELLVHSYRSQDSATRLAEFISKFAGVPYRVEEPKPTFLEHLFG